MRRHSIQLHSNRKCTDLVDNRHFLRPLAEQDIADIWTLGADRWGVDQADRYFDGMVDLFDLLSEQPEIARLRNEFKPPVRIHIYGSHIVIFETVETGIAVIRVLHQRRDILALLGE
ncbi:MAG: type II toxin-antitoxin system RelE/ParE family toxin [Rhodobacteraceae bacterium]|nr:type II toxin-antitoxin system RelE/ParE family toxin [Paracoccaceae bacterium]